MKNAITRRTLLKSAAIGTTGILAQNATSQPKTNKNVLLIIADDHGKDMPSYGNQAIKTPNLEQLASDGIRFTNAFCTTPSCSASRSVIFTGLQNHLNGQYGHTHSYNHFSMRDHIVPLPTLLKKAGYKTGIIGKFHVEPAENFAWDMYVSGRRVGGNRNVTEMAKVADSFFEENQENPFFLTVSYSDPHRAGEGFGNETNKSEIEPTVYSPDEVQVPDFLPDQPEVRKELTEYYQAVSRVDAGVGLVLKALKDKGLHENTLVIYFTDNGIPFPGAKSCLYDPGINLPMLVRSPDQKQKGIVNNAMVSFTDLVPTILDWTGAQPPEYDLHGRSFLPVLHEENPRGWDEIFFSHTFHEITMYYPSRGIRTKKYKYINNLAHNLQFPFASDLYASKTWQGVLERQDNYIGKRPVVDYLYRDEEELYDIENDPNEINNLAYDPAYKDELETLRKKVLDFRKRTQDPWLILNRYEKNNMYKRE